MTLGLGQESEPDVQCIPASERRFSHVHLDLVAPLSSSWGFSYLLKMFDQTLVGRRLFLSPTSLLKAVLMLFCYPGCLGSEFQLSFPQTGVHSSHPPSGHRFSTSSEFLLFKPQVSILRATGSAGADWVRHLPPVMFGLHAAPGDKSVVVYGSMLSLPAQFPGFMETFIWRVELAVSGFSRPPPHNVPPASCPIPLWISWKQLSLYLPGRKHL